MKQIRDFENYYIDEYGNVFSDITGKLKQKKPWLDSKKRYYMIGLSKNGKVYKKLIHRLVAQTFLKNPNNLPVVNHKDSNCQNNYVGNLEWCSTQENIHHSYTTMNQYRNEKKCVLYLNNDVVKTFPNIKAAAKYAAETYGASFTGLYRNMKSKNVSIVRCND